MTIAKLTSISPGTEFRIYAATTEQQEILRNFDKSSAWPPQEVLSTISHGPFMKVEQNHSLVEFPNATARAWGVEQLQKRGFWKSEPK